MLGALSELIELRDRDKYPELEEIFVKIDGSADLKKIRDFKLALCFNNLIQTVSKLPSPHHDFKKLESELKVDIENIE